MKGLAQMDPFQPRLLVVNDFAPSDSGAGPLQLLRLLSEHDPAKLFLVCSARQVGDLGSNAFAKSKRIVLPQFAGTRIHGWRRLFPILDRMTTPFLSVVVAVVTLLWRPTAIISVAHGYYFLAAAVASSVTNTKLVLIVHDDWLALTWMYVYLFRRIARRLFKYALRRATTVLAVSHSMAQHLKEHYGVDSVVLFPCASKNTCPSVDYMQAPPQGTVRLTFCGNISHTVEDGIDLVARCLNSPAFHAKIGKSVHFTIFSQFPRDVMERRGWLSEFVVVGAWVPRMELDQAIAASDIMLLPIGFSDSSAFYAATSFPSKIADYLAAGKPILVIGPENSPVVQYLAQQPYAIVVDSLDLDRLVCVLHDLLRDRARLKAMSDSAYHAFQQDYDAQEARRRLYQYIGDLAS